MHQWKPSGMSCGGVEDGRVIVQTLRACPLREDYWIATSNCTRQTLRLTRSLESVTGPPTISITCCIRDARVMVFCCIQPCRSRPIRRSLARTRMPSFAYLSSLEPVHESNRVNELRFPYK